MVETIIELVNENGGCVITVSVLQAWKCNSHETGICSPSDSSIDLKCIGNWPDYSLPSIYSSAKSIKCCQRG